MSKLNLSLEQQKCILIFIENQTSLKATVEKSIKAKNVLLCFDQFHLDVLNDNELKIGDEIMLHKNFEFVVTKSKAETKSDLPDRSGVSSPIGLTIPTGRKH